MTEQQLSFDLTETNSATLSSSAMLVELNISQWAGNKQDKSASKKVTADNNAKVGVARVNKSLLAGCATLETIKKLTTEVRGFHAKQTLPWSDSGQRVVSTQAYIE